jgi:transcriptional regulator with XRE-family HTH domain
MVQFNPHRWLTMAFPERLAELRKAKNLTQQALADQISMHVVQIRRYEAGDSQPTLDVIRKLAIALSVSADVLIFDKDERGPDDDLRLQFEALSQFTPEEKAVARVVLDSLILQHTAKRFSGNAGQGTRPAA